MGTSSTARRPSLGPPPPPNTNGAPIGAAQEPSTAPGSPSPSPRPSASTSHASQAPDGGPPRPKTLGDTAPKRAFPFVPRLELFSETLLLEEDEGDREASAAVATLSYIYQEGEVRAGADEPTEDEQPFRDLDAEAVAARILESFGAIELSTIGGCLADFDSKANYLITLGTEVHIGCSFSAHAVREMKRNGFEVIEHPSYPFTTVSPETPLYGAIDTDEKLDWFTVELGVEIDGCSYNLVPALLELLEQVAEGASFEELANCPSRFRAVALGDGRYVVMPWERLEKILNVLAELYPNDGSGRKEEPIPLARISDLGGLDDAVLSDGGEVSWITGEEWLDRAKALSTGPEWSPQPASLKATLRSYQHEGLMWLEHLRDAGVGGVLADDMGLGKTLQTIALLAREKEARRMDRPTIIITPTSLVGNWKQEIEKFCPHLRVFCHVGPRRHQKAAEFDRAEVVLTSYPILTRDLMGLQEREYHYLILDEAQAVKNPRSQASTSVRALSARHRLALSGTPVENNLGELWALFEFVMPGLLGRASEFKKNFRDPIEKNADEGRLLKLKKRVSPFILRRVKESVAKDLPPKTELVRAVELSGDQRDLYESIRLAADREVRRAIAEKGMGSSSITILDALTKLRQVCCDPRLVPVESARKVKNSAKYRLFFQLLETQLSEGRRVLVFSQFARMLGLLARGLEQRGVKYLSLTGQSNNRQTLVERFEKGEADVFLISLKAGGTGLNLVSADTVIHYDPWWNAAAQMQATDRAYRIGQTKPVFVYNLIAASSVEERMLSLQSRKRHLADTILGSTGGGALGLSELDVDDLFAPLDGDDAL